MTMQAGKFVLATLVSSLLAITAAGRSDAQAVPAQPPEHAANPPKPDKKDDGQEKKDKDVFRLSGPWRPIYVITATIALWLNCFVGVVQGFQKLPFLIPLAPTQSEPPFLVAQIVVLGILALLGALALRRFHPAWA